MNLVKDFKGPKLGDWKKVSDEVKPGRRLILEEGVQRSFDMHPDMIEEVQGKADIDKLATDLEGKSGDDAKAIYQAFGKALMEATVDAADNKFKDRTGEMVETIAKQTGQNFPHRFSRYIELSILSLRPHDKWNIKQSSTVVLKVEEFGCKIYKTLTEKGIDLKSLPCRELCFATFEAAAGPAEVKESHELTASMAADGKCEFTFHNKD